MKRLTLLALTTCCAVAQDVDSRRFVQSEKEDASWMVTLVCSLDGVFSNHQQIFYLRAPRDITDLGSRKFASTNADGGGTGFGLTARAVPRETTVEMEVSAHWTSKSAHGKSELTLLVPYFETKTGKDAGFSYAATWKKIR